MDSLAKNVLGSLDTAVLLNVPAPQESNPVGGLTAETAVRKSYTKTCNPEKVEPEIFARLDRGA
jgi:hypothetical protein